ncbi:MAG: hypothetical protein WC865_10810 [Bacteroidales bacterium]
MMFIPENVLYFNYLSLFMITQFSCFNHTIIRIIAAAFYDLGQLPGTIFRLASRTHFYGFPCTYLAISHRVNYSRFYFFHDQSGATLYTCIHITTKVQARYVANYLVQGVVIVDLFE